MAGKHPIDHQTKASIQKWMDTLAAPDGWHANNLHIDEVHGYRKVKRRDWMRCSLDVMPLMLHLADPGLGLKYFLHNDLKDRTLKIAVEKSIKEGYFQEIFSKKL